MTSFHCTNETGFPASIVVTIDGGAGSTHAAPPQRQTILPVPLRYTAYCTITLAYGETRRSAPVTVPQDGAALIARLVVIDPIGSFNLWLEVAPAEVPDEIQMINDCHPYAVNFILTALPHGATGVALEGEVNCGATPPGITLVQDGTGHALKLSP